MNRKKEEKGKRKRKKRENRRKNAVYGGSDRYKVKLKKARGNPHHWGKIASEHITTFFFSSEGNTSTAEAGEGRHTKV